MPSAAALGGASLPALVRLTRSRARHESRRTDLGGGLKLLQGAGCNVLAMPAARTAR